MAPKKTQTSLKDFFQKPSAMASNQQPQTQPAVSSSTVRTGQLASIPAAKPKIIQTQPKLASTSTLPQAKAGNSVSGLPDKPAADETSSDEDEIDYEVIGDQGEEEISDDDSQTGSIDSERAALVQAREMELQAIMDAETKSGPIMRYISTEKYAFDVSSIPKPNPDEDFDEEDF